MWKHILSAFPIAWYKKQNQIKAFQYIARDKFGVGVDIWNFICVRSKIRNQNIVVQVGKW